MNQLSRYVRGPLILVALLVIARYLFPSKMTFFWEVSTFGIYIIANDILYGYIIRIYCNFYFGAICITLVISFKFFGQSAQMRY